MTRINGWLCWALLLSSGAVVGAAAASMWRPLIVSRPVAVLMSNDISRNRGFTIDVPFDTSLPGPVLELKDGCFTVHTNYGRPRNREWSCKVLSQRARFVGTFATSTDLWGAKRL
jgi:hypothetical protein